MAVYTLPYEMIGFYKANIDWISEHAVDPDKRRYADKAEAPRHYIDLDEYEEIPFDSIPKRWDHAKEKFTEDTLQAYGILPWHLQLMMHKLTMAFEEKNEQNILRYSADIGHYIADAHVPLHTTKNYNGQLTGQKGIHGFWESRIPELRGDEYDYLVGKAQYIENIQEEIWQIVHASFGQKDSVLLFEANLNEEYAADAKYGYEKRGKRSVKVYSREYSLAYERMLDGMIERNMRAAIKSVSNFWFTAWVLAGQPKLSSEGFIPIASGDTSYIPSGSLPGHEDE